MLNHEYKAFETDFWAAYGLMQDADFTVLLQLDAT